MLQRIRKAMKEESGFTLIELLIVIVILGILAAIVVFSVQGIQDKGKTSACQSDVASVTTAAESYYAQHGAYPAVATVATDLSPAFLHTYPAVVTYALAATGFTATGPAGITATDPSGC